MRQQNERPWDERKRINKLLSRHRNRDTLGGGCHVHDPFTHTETGLGFEDRAQRVASQGAVGRCSPNGNGLLTTECIPQGKQFSSRMLAGEHGRNKLSCQESFLFEGQV